MAIALGLHVGAGWALASAGPFDKPMQRVEERLLWLESALEADEKVADREVVVAPTPRPSAGERVAAVRRAAAPRAPSDPASRSWVSPAGARDSDPSRDAPHPAASAAEPPAAMFQPAAPAAATRAEAPPRVGLQPSPLASGRGPEFMAAPGLHGSGLSSLAGGWSGAGLSTSGRADALGGGPMARSPAHLLAASNRCADLFPYAALSDTGTVAVELDVASSGYALSSHIVDEAPRGQGFGLAASHCVRRLRFSPATDGRGHVVASRSVVRLRFQRRGASVAL